MLELLDSVTGSGDVDVSDRLSSEEVQKQVTGQAPESHPGRVPVGADRRVRACPLDVQAEVSRPHRHQPARGGDIAEQRVVLACWESPRVAAIGAPDVLVVDEELVEVRYPAHRR